MIDADFPGVTYGTLSFSPNKPNTTMKTPRIQDISAPLQERVFYIDFSDAEPSEELVNEKKQRLNIREDMGDLFDFAESLRGGIRLPSTGYMGANGKFQITDGERRWRAGRIIRARNVDLRFPVTLEPKGYTREDRLVNMLVTATGKPLDIIEQANGIALLLDGLEGKARAKKIKSLPKIIGKSETHIANCLALLAAPGEIKDAVRKGEITGSLAVDLGREVPDHKQQVDVLEQARGKAKSKGKKKITAKLLPVKTGKKAQAAKKEKKTADAPSFASTISNSGVSESTRPSRKSAGRGTSSDLDSLLDILHSMDRRSAEAERYETLEMITEFLGGKETRKSLTQFILGIS